MSFQSLKNHLLIAMPTLSDPLFYRTVTLICEHSAEGAMGLIINQPSHVQLIDLFEEFELDIAFSVDESKEVLNGGPVQIDRGFVIHKPGMEQWQSTLELSESIAITTSLDIIEALANNTAPSESYVALGYAGWGAGQLEDEIIQNAWLTVPATEKVVFQLPFEERWEAAAQLLGVDIYQISRDIGHG